MAEAYLSDKYKFREDELIDEFIRYVNSTYGQHYSRNKFQATEFIIDGGHGIGFMIGNILKYAQRYGRKGTPDDYRKDLMKVLHYTLLALYVHDLEEKEYDPAIHGNSWYMHSLELEKELELQLTEEGKSIKTIAEEWKKDYEENIKM